MRKWIGALVLLGLGSGHAGTIYRCESATGRTIFSDSPCGPDAEARDMPEAQVVHSDMKVSPAEQQRLDQELAARMHKERLARLDNRIDNKQQQIAAARQARDGELRNLADRMGATRGPVHARQQVELGIVRQRHQDRIRELEQDLRDLRKERETAARY